MVGECKTSESRGIITRTNVSLDVYHLSLFCFPEKHDFFLFLLSHFGIRWSGTSLIRIGTISGTILFCLHHMIYYNHFFKETCYSIRFPGGENGTVLI